jgi:hypothetical protein
VYPPNGGGVAEPARTRRVTAKACPGAESGAGTKEKINQIALKTQVFHVKRYNELINSLGVYENQTGKRVF